MTRSIAVVLACALLTSCGSGKSNPSAGGTTVVYARGDQTDSLDPPSTEWGGSAKIMVNLFETLVSFSEDGIDVVPRLAERWERSQDGKTWTFHLRKGVKFHDGTAFDAGAVQFSFSRLLGKGEHLPRAIPYGPQYHVIDSIASSDSQTVVFRLKEPSAVFLMNLAMFPAGIVSPAAVRASGAAGFSTNPVGTGPLKFKEWQRDVKIVLTRNPDYWGAPAKMERLIILDVKDAKTAVQKLKNGEVDAIDKMTLADVAAIESDSGLYMEYEASMNVCYLTFNMGRDPDRDPNFRKAIAHALDRKKIVELAYHGKAEEASSILPPSIFPGAAGDPSYPHDPAKAREYLAKVKLPEGYEARLWHMAYDRPYVPEPDKLAQVIQEQLSRIGLKVRLEGFNQDIYSRKTHDLEHPMLILGWSADIADPDNFLYALLHGDSIGPRQKPDGTNSSFFDHSGFNAIVKEAQSVVDAGQRRQKYEAALKILREEVPVIPLAHVRQMAAVSKRVKYNHHPIEYRFWNIERTR
jgi:peptide/nickel transport system substrate-binding protein